jgi:VanZ family protein
MFLRYNFPGIIWGILILILMGLPGHDFPDTSFIKIPNFDKLVHFGLFFIFVFLLLRGFAKQFHFPLLKKYALLFSLLIGIAYGGLTEILQGTVFIERTCDFYDFLADTVGCVLGMTFFLLLKGKIIREK